MMQTSLYAKMRLVRKNGKVNVLCMVCFVDLFQSERQSFYEQEDFRKNQSCKSVKDVAR